MRLLIYLLAMLTGFSAAEAARPLSAVPASVDAAVGQAYAVAAVKVAEKALVAAEHAEPVSVVPAVEVPIVAELSVIAPTTPVLRHDVILG
jgi:hypothetical protein